LLPDIAVPRESPDILDSRDSSPFNTLRSDSSGTEVPTAAKGRPLGVKNKPNSWKNTAVPAWKPPSKLKIYSDQNSIANRTRLLSLNNVKPQIHDDLVPNF
jgi:hypothetical protein